MLLLLLPLLSFFVVVAAVMAAVIVAAVLAAVVVALGAGDAFTCYCYAKRHSVARFCAIANDYTNVDL